MRTYEHPKPHPTSVPLRDVLPDFPKWLETDLRKGRLPVLANQVDSLRVYGRCTCGSPTCGTYYCLRPDELEKMTGLGQDSRSVTVVEGRITRIETLDPRVDELVLGSVLEAGPVRLEQAFRNTELSLRVADRQWGIEKLSPS